ncbi:MAG: hypothetical protein ABEJ77_03715 [Halanaeroarchaeum sp.]
MSSDREDEPENVADDVSFGGVSAAFWALVIAAGVALFLWDFGNLVSHSLESGGYPIGVINNLKVTLMTLEMIGGGGTILVIGYIIWRYAAAYRSSPTPLRPGQGKYTLTVWVIGVLFLMAMAIFMGAGALAQTDQARQPIEKVSTSRELDMHVVGAQWTWRMKVEGVPFVQSERVVLPSNTLVKFSVTSGDVIHSFAVQELGIKKDAIPGQLNHASFMVDHVSGETTIQAGGETVPADVYQINCAELCGKGHSQMVSKIYVVSPEHYQQWVEANGGTVPDSFTVEGSDSSMSPQDATARPEVTADV